MFERLREELDRRGIATGFVILPGDSGIPLEGALSLGLNNDRFQLSTVDYGRGFPLGFADDENAAAALLLKYLDQQLPEPTTIRREDLAAAAAAASPGFADLLARTKQGSLLIEIPAGIPIDRVGALDGTILFPIGTSIQARALPPTALQPDARLYQFIVRKPFLVRVETVPPWFGQPGGGLRCTISQDFVGIRDYVAGGVLEHVVVPA